MTLSLVRHGRKSANWFYLKRMQFDETVLFVESLWGPILYRTGYSFEGSASMVLLIANNHGSSDLFKDPTL